MKRILANSERLDIALNLLTNEQVAEFAEKCADAENKPHTIESWRVIMMTTNDKAIALEDVPNEAGRLIDECIRNGYNVTWK